jgi:hypothetical protein
MMGLCVLAAIWKPFSASTGSTFWCILLAANCAFMFISTIPEEILLNRVSRFNRTMHTDSGRQELHERIAALKAKLK